MLAGLDHKAIVARYDIPVYSDKECIPTDRFFAGWVISRRLEQDNLFLDEAKEILEHIKLESEENDINSFDASFYWLKAKIAIIHLAKKREKELFWEDQNKMDVLKCFYSSLVKDIQNGEDCFQELERIKIDMNHIYRDRCRQNIDKMRGLEIDDHTYDIHKLQNKRKFENQSRIREVKINGRVYEGSVNVGGGQ